MLSVSGIHDEIEWRSWDNTFKKPYIHTLHGKTRHVRS